MSTSYSNSSGNGDRTWLVLVKSDLTYGTGGGSDGDWPALLVSGTLKTYFPGSQAVSGKSITFDFGTAKLVDEVTWTQDAASSHGTWKWQGSSDDSSWTDIGSSFTLGGSTSQVQTQLNGNVTSYRYYRLLGVSGNTSNTPFLTGITFKISALDTAVSDYGNNYGQGNRTANLTASSSQTSGSSNLLTAGSGLAADHSLFVDGANLQGIGTFRIFFPTVNNAVSIAGKWIQVQFPSAVVISEIKWFQDTQATHGVWKVQGSNDASAWTDLGSSFTLGAGYDTARGYSKITTPSANTTAYLYYRLLGVSGSTSDGPFLYEMAFRIAATVSLVLTKSDTVNNLADAQTNSGLGHAANAQFESLTFTDAVALFGGDPFYHATFGDSINIQDQLQNFVPKIAKLFSDTINNLTESVVDLIGIPIKAFDSQQFNWDESLSVTLLTVLREQLSDSVFNYTDLATLLVKNVPILLHIADTVNFIADAQKIFDRLTLLAGDNFVISDSVSLRFIHLLKIAETLTALLEALGISVKDRPAFSDSFTITDAAALRLAVQNSVTKSDTLALSDHVVTSATGDYSAPGFIDRIRRYLGDTN